MSRYFLLIISTLTLITFNISAQNQANLLRELIDLPSPPPPMKEEETDEKNKKIARPLSFYADKNVPSDDASIDDVLAYWVYKASQNYCGMCNSPKASPKSAERILANVKNEAERLTSFLKIFPNTPEVGEIVKQIFDSSQNKEGIDESWKKTVKSWLKLNSNLYLDELIADAEKAKDHPKYFTVDKESELKALAEVDWEKAQPILQRLESDTSNPRTAVYATSLFYEHAIEVKNQSDEQKYRKKLKANLENSKLPARARDIASDALFLTDWEGQDEYYLSLMSDKTLFRMSDGIYGFTPLTTLPDRNPDKWIPILVKLVGNQNRAIHNVAVMNLVDFRGRKDAMEPLLSWLTNPKWADINWSPGGRTTYMQIVSDVDLPQSIPGLIWIIENEDSEAHWAANSLAKFKDSRAVPALKSALNRIGLETYRRDFIKALIACNGLTDDEKMIALETYANFIAEPGNYEKIQNRHPYEDKDPLPVELSIGSYISEIPNPTEGLIILSTERQKALQKDKPQVAKILSGIIAKWRGKLVDLELLERIKTGKADVETIVGALARRKELRENVSDEIKSLQKVGGLPKGISACLLEDETQLLQSFRSKNIETKVSVLGCARLLRLKLPVQEVAKDLNDSDKLLALASERYLESEDSKEALQFVLGKHPNEALILGARNSFNPTRMVTFPSTLEMLFATVDNSYRNSLHPSDSYYQELNKFEDKLRDELKSNTDLVETFALVPNYVVRIYKDKAMLTWYENAARYREIGLQPGQVEKLRKFWENNKIEEMPPLFGNCHYDCGGVNVIRVNKNGGRRFFAYTSIGSLVTIFANFQTLADRNESKIHYYSQNAIKELQILFADDAFSVKSIWKNGNDFRVLIEDTEKENQVIEENDEQNDSDNKNEKLDWEERDKRRNRRQTQRKYEHFEWHKFNNGKLGEIVEQPADVPFLRGKDDVLNENLVDYRADKEVWKVKGGNYEVYAGDNQKKGIWKATRSQGEIKLHDGWYLDAIITPNGKWAIAAKTDTDWASPNYVVRVNIQTGKEDKINITPANNLYPIAFLPDWRKVLIYSSDVDYAFENPLAKYYLLEADTGAVEEVKGEFRPLKQQSFRPLQKTANSNEFWAAIPDKNKNETKIGRYNSKTFTFNSLTVVPNILFDSMDIWVDESENKVYLIYGEYRNYQMLSLPLLK